MGAELDTHSKTVTMLKVHMYNIYMEDSSSFRSQLNSSLATQFFPFPQEDKACFHNTLERSYSRSSSVIIVLFLCYQYPLLEQLS